MTKSPFIGAAACTFRKAGIILCTFLTLCPRPVKAQTPGTVEAGFRVDSNGVIMGTAVQPDAKILVFGTFNTLGGITRPRLARLNADGSLESTATFNLGSGISGGVQNVVVQNDGKILIAGDFTAVNGQPRNRIARLNPDGSLESTLTFNPGAGADAQINAVAVQPDGKILLGGNFTAINGLPRNRIARLLPDGAVESTSTFNAGTGVSANASPGVVYCMLLQPDGKIFIAGSFDKVNDLARKNIARLNADGSVENTATFNPGTGVGGVLRSCALQPDGGILLGDPGSVNGQSRPNLARLLPNGSLDNAGFNSGAGGYSVNCLTLQADGRILIGGTFETVGGLTRRRIARIMPDGNVDSAFTFDSGPSDPGNILSMTLQADGKILFSNGYYLGRCANDPATQRLSNSGSTQIKWERGGACPELEQVTFDLSTNAGANWSPLGAGTRIQGGWLYTGPALPQAGLIRGRGRTSSGHYNGARGMVEAVSTILVQAIRIQGTQTYTENFNGLGTANANWIDNFPLSGWYAQIFNGVTPVGTIKAVDGSMEAAGVLNLGTAGASDRALGSAVTGVGLMANAAVGVLFQNTGTTPVKLSEISYAGELWRANTLNNPEKYTLFYQISASPVASLLSGGPGSTPDPGEGYTALGAAANWTSVAGPPFTALDGNAPAFRSTVTFDASAVIPVIPAGHYCMLKWTDTNEAGTDGFQGIDDVRVRFIEYPCSLSAQVSSVARQQNGPGLADDTFTFNVTVNQTNASAAWHANTVATDGAQTGPYGVVKSFGPYPVSQSPKAIVFTDSADAACTVSATGTAPVYNPVNITSQPVALSVVQGQSASFSVTAAGTAPAYQWKKGNDPINGATGSTYTIPVTQYTDAGSYSVVVSNDAGSVPSNAVTLTVREPDKAPASLGGRTIHLTISSGSYPFASSGAFRFLPSVTDDAFAIVPVSGETLASEGTHTYSKTGANTARLSLNSTVAGPVIATCNFTTPASGTFSLYSEWYGGSQSGTFSLFSGPSPAAVSGAKITVNITSGISPFSSSGSYRLEPAVTGNTYTLKALSGSVVDSHGTYSYYKNSANTALVDFVDSETGPGLGSQLSFETATTGTLALREAGSDSYQTGLFTMKLPPSLSVIAGQITAEDVLAGPLAFTVSDAETAAASLTVSAVSSNTTLVPNANLVFGGSGASRTLTVKPALNQSGSTTITVTVKDGDNLAASESFEVTVNAVNDAPVISGLSDKSAAEDTAPAAWSFTVSDVETVAAALTVSAISSNTALVPQANIVLGGSGGSRTIKVTPAANQSGTSTITLTVNDGAVSGSAVFVFTVTPVNDGPAISDVPNQTTNEDTSVASIPVTVGDVDNAVDALTLSGASSNTTLVPAANIVFSGTGASRFVTVTPAANRNGTATITLTVSDGTATVSDTFTLTVAAVNDVPAITDITDHTVNEDTATAAISFVVGDAETSVNSLTIAKASSNTVLVPASAIVIGGSGANRTVTVTPAANQSGSAVITLTVSDGTATQSDSFLLTVTPVNDPPVISNVSNLSISEDTPTGAIAFTISDPETAAEALTVGGGSSNTVLLPLTGITFGGSAGNRTVILTPAVNQSGTSTITLTVSDGTATASDTFVLTVSAVNDAPVIPDLPDLTVFKNTSSGPLALLIGDAETAASSLTVTRASSNTALLPNSAVVLGGSGANRTVTLSPVANQTGTSTITLTVSDGSKTATDTFLVTVTDQPPFALWKQAQFGAGAGNAAIAGDLANPDGDQLVNLLEYALGGNPNSASSAPAPVSSVINNRVSLTFTRFPANADVTITVQGANSLSGPWSDLAQSTAGSIMTALTGGVSVMETGTGTSRAVEVRDLYTIGTASPPGRFLRLKVSH